MQINALLRLLANSIYLGRFSTSLPSDWSLLIRLLVLSSISFSRYSLLCLVALRATYHNKEKPRAEGKHQNRNMTQDVLKHRVYSLYTDNRKLTFNKKRSCICSMVSSFLAVIST